MCFGECNSSFSSSKCSQVVLYSLKMSLFVHSLSLRYSKRDISASVSSIAHTIVGALCLCITATK